MSRPERTDRLAPFPRRPLRLRRRGVREDQDLEVQGRGRTRADLDPSFEEIDRLMRQPSRRIL